MERERSRLSRFEDEIRNARRGLTYYVSVVSFVMQEISYSYLSQMMLLCFDLTYGFTQTISTRRLYNQDVIGNQNEMGFGQLVPLILLLLPWFSAGEVYIGKSRHRESMTRC